MRILMLSFIFGVLFLGFLTEFGDGTVVDQARADLASRLGVSSKQVEVVYVEHVNWHDTCLGVYRPGQMCAAVVTPGLRILLQYGGRDYYYNTSDTRIVYQGL
jgi:hypothetical protein